MPDNGTLSASQREVKLSTPVVRRLARLHARAEGAQLVVQAAAQAQQQMQQVLREALTEACEEEGVSIPEGGTAPVDIDWRTGVVKIGQPDMGTGMALPLPPAPVEPAAGVEN